jgi:predicted nucleotidyltransferase
MLAGLGLILATLIYIGAPLLRRVPMGSEQTLRREKQHERLMLVYERVLRNLRDLDEDFATGKMPPQDYQSEREVWMQRGIQVLKALDGLEANQMVADTADIEQIDTAIDSQIEAAVAAYRARLPQA